MAVLAAAASLSVLVPLHRGHGRTNARASAEISIYKDQLDEIERDLGRGLIGDGEATAARTEIGRRLLHADAARGEARTTSALRRRVATAAAIVAIPAVAVGLYVRLGSPALPDEPLTARLAAPVDQQDLPTLVARVEARLAAQPDD